MRHLTTGRGKIYQPDNFVLVRRDSDTQKASALLALAKQHNAKPAAKAAIWAGGASCMMRRGRPRAALKLLRKCSASLKANGASNVERANGWLNESAALYACGDHPEALGSAEKSAAVLHADLDKFESSVSPAGSVCISACPSVLNSCVALSFICPLLARRMTYLRMQRNVQATVSGFFQRALITRDWLDTACLLCMSLYGVAMAHLAQGQRAPAVAALQESVAIANKWLGPERPVSRVLARVRDHEMMTVITT